MKPFLMFTIMKWDKIRGAASPPKLSYFVFERLRIALY